MRTKKRKTVNQETSQTMEDSTCRSEDTNPGSVNLGDLRQLPPEIRRIIYSYLVDDSDYLKPECSGVIDQDEPLPAIMHAAQAPFIETADLFCNFRLHIYEPTWCLDRAAMAQCEVRQERNERVARRERQMVQIQARLGGPTVTHVPAQRAPQITAVLQAHSITAAHLAGTTVVPPFLQQATVYPVTIQTGAAPQINAAAPPNVHNAAATVPRRGNNPPTTQPRRQRSAPSGISHSRRQQMIHQQILNHAAQIATAAPPVQPAAQAPRPPHPAAPVQGVVLPVHFTTGPAAPAPTAATAAPIAAPAASNTVVAPVVAAPSNSVLATAGPITAHPTTVASAAPPQIATAQTTAAPTPVAPTAATAAAAPNPNANHAALIAAVSQRGSFNVSHPAKRPPSAMWLRRFDYYGYRFRSLRFALREHPDLEFDVDWTEAGVKISCLDQPDDLLLVHANWLHGLLAEWERVLTDRMRLRRVEAFGFDEVRELAGLVGEMCFRTEHDGDGICDCGVNV